MLSCKRCELEFKLKSDLIRHLNRKRICMAIGGDILRIELLKELNEKGDKKVECSKCNNIYKNKESLRRHKCKEVDSKEVDSKKDIEGLKRELINRYELVEKEIEILKNEMKELRDRPSNITNITNNDNSKRINKNIDNSKYINVTVNCLMDTSGKAIEYLLNSENIKERILKWVNSKRGLLEYIDEKFYNAEHPENKMIKRGKDSDSIELHISGRWKKLENIKASDLILTNVGNDFMSYIDIAKGNEEVYKENREVLKKFENEVMKPLEWGIEISEDSNNMVTKTIIKNEKGEYIYKEDELENDKKVEMRRKVVSYIHNKNE